MLEIKNIYKTYYLKKAPPTHALIDVSVKFESRGMVFILGKSGSGKSTFLNVVGGLDRYDAGEIIIKGKSSGEFTGSDFDSYRNTYLGFIFQEYNIIEEFTIGENIALALELQHKKAGKDDVERILKEVDMQGYGGRFPNQISGGQRQRVAIARALIKEPEIIFADEPTGALDSATGEQIFETLKRLSNDKLVIVVSHDREYAEMYGDRIIEFKDGRIVSDMIKEESGFNEQLIVDGATIVQDMVKIPKGSSLTSAHTEIINDMLSKGELIISSNQGLNRYFLTEFDTSSRRRGHFAPTTEEKLNFSEETSPFRLIKSRLPATNARKMALSSMSHKKGRLIFSIILSIFAVMFFGFSNVLGGFSQRTVLANVINDYDYQYMAISRQIKKDKVVDYEAAAIAFEQDDIQRLDQIVDGGMARFMSSHLMIPAHSNPESKYSYHYFNSHITGVVCGDLQRLNLPVPAVYGRFPAKADEILITNYTAQHFMAMGMYYVDKNPLSTNLEILESKHINQLNDILSYAVPFTDPYGESIDLKIVGIINFNIARYEPLLLNETLSNTSAALYNEFFERKSHELSYIYGTEGLASYFEGARIGENTRVNYNLPDLYAKSGWQPNVTATSYSIFNDYSYYYPTNYLPKVNGQAFTQPKQNEVIINLNAYNMVVSTINSTQYDSVVYSNEQMEQMAQEYGIFDDDFTLNARFLLGNMGYEIGAASNLKVIGVISTTGFRYDNPIAIFADEQYNELVKLDRYEAYFVYLKDNATLNAVIKNYVGDYKINGDIYNSYVYRLPFGDAIMQIDMMFRLMSFIFVLLGGALCVFSALLLLNFITTSVAYKKKEIGILRAIGARKSDVISVFLWEGLFIGLWIIGFATALVFSLVVVFNNLMSFYAAVPFSLLSFGIFDILLMALVGFFTIALASILPVSRITSKNPIDAIRG